MTISDTRAEDIRQSASVAEPLLVSKIVPPGLPGWTVPRPRIDKSIEKGVRHGAVTVVTGPPGAGKTTGLAAWVAGERWPGPVAWLTVDEYDNHPDLFWRYVSAALRQAGLRPAFSGHNRFHGRDPGALLRLASVLAGQFPPAVLVLDDLHLLTHPRIAAELSYVLLHSRPGLRVITASRTEPRLPLHKYLLTGDLTEIGGDQLAFTGPEARQLLHNHGVTAYSESLMSLITKTEGWVAGLRLAAIAQRESAETAGNLGSVRHPVTAYLTNEVIDALPRHARDFVLRTSVLDSVSPDLALALTGQQDAAVTLAGLQGNGTFIRNAGSGWYRYHPLFAEVLRARLRDEHPGMAGNLQRRAAIWFRRRGRLTDAVRYAVRAGDWELAARIVIDELAVGELLDPGSGRGFTAALQGILPQESWTQPQPFLVAAAVALARLDCDSSATWLGRADDLLHGLPIDQQIPSRLAAALIRYDLARCAGDLDALRSGAAEAEAMLSRLPPHARAQHPELVVRALSNDGLAALWLGRLDDAEKLLAEATALPVPAAEAGEPASCIGSLALTEAFDGRLGRAHELAARAITASAAAAGDPVREPPPNVPADIALALVHLERYELAEVRDSLKRAEAGLRMRRDRAAAAAASLVAARLYLAEGRHAAAARMLSRARQDWSPPAWLARRLALAESHACTMAGDTRAALDAADRSGGDRDLDAAVARAAAWLAAGDLKAAGRALRRALESAEVRQGQSIGTALLDALLFDARIHYANGDRKAGRRSLARALGIGHGEDVRLPFAMERTWVLPVLRTDADLAQSFRALIQPAAADGGHDALRSLVRDLQQPAVVEPLTDREQEVLRRVAQLMSTTEIANELHISVNTVKTHLKSAHRKLAVTHRREAVRRARQLNLLLAAGRSACRVPLAG
jgi:LuxR family transcriptional regulator, maltose regulon positive regulatory protein